MKKNFFSNKLMLLASISLLVINSSCNKEKIETQSGANENQKVNIEPTSAVAAALAYPSNINTGFNHADGSYSYEEASADFGGASITGWNDTRAYISGNQARATLAPNSVSKRPLERPITKKVKG